MFKRILLPTDGSDISKKAVKKGIEFAKSINAKVVGFFSSSDGRPCDQTGWPILKAIGANGKARGGKWVADPTKTEVA